jgi:hypothetical protein
VDPSHTPISDAPPAASVTVASMVLSPSSAMKNVTVTVRSGPLCDSFVVGSSSMDSPRSV